MGQIDFGIDIHQPEQFEDAARISQRWARWVRLLPGFALQQFATEQTRFWMAVSLAHLNTSYAIALGLWSSDRARSPGSGAHGRLRASLRKLDPRLSTDFIPIQSFDQPQMLHPGEIVSVDIAIMPASEVFHAGEQLRLTVAGHEFTAPSAEPLTGVLAFTHPLPPLPTNNAGVHVIHAGGDDHSFLQIPVIPVGR